MAQASSKWPKCIIVVVVGEYQKPNHTISKNIKTLIISRAEKKCFFPSPRRNMQSAALQAKPDSGPIGETSKRKEKCLRLKCIWTLQMISLASRANILLLFMTGAADFKKIQVTVQLRISLSSDLRAGWRFLRALKCTLASKVKHVVTRLLLSYTSRYFKI